MKNKVLHMVAYDLNGILYGKGIKVEESIPEETISNSAGLWYLHGKLEEITGYDKAIALNLRELGLIKPGNRLNNGKDSIYINDILPVKVYGIISPCIGYFWTELWGRDGWKQRGLVCLFSDVSGRFSARERFRVGVEETNRDYYEGNDRILPDIVI